MQENKLIATFRGHKVRNEHKCIFRFFDNPIQPWTILGYDEVFNKQYTIPKEELYDFVVGVLFNRRRLWTTGAELDVLFSHIHVPYGERHLLIEPDIVDTVCFLKDKYIKKLDSGELSYSEISVLQESIAKKVNWLAPHPCLVVTDNITKKVLDLFITMPEYSSVILGNPEYFDVKDKTR